MLQHTTKSMTKAEFSKKWAESKYRIKRGDIVATADPSKPAAVNTTERDPFVRIVPISHYDNETGIATIGQVLSTDDKTTGKICFIQSYDGKDIFAVKIYKVTDTYCCGTAGPHPDAE